MTPTQLELATQFFVGLRSQVGSTEAALAHTRQQFGIYDRKSLLDSIRLRYAETEQALPFDFPGIG